MWENGKNHPEHNTLLKIADFFDVPVDYLIGNDVEELKNVNTATRIKVYGHVPAGIPLEAVEDVIDWEEIPSDWTKNGSEFLALKVKGNSMNPKYLDGDIIIIRKQPNAKVTRAVLFVMNMMQHSKVIKIVIPIIWQPLNPEHATKFYGSVIDLVLYSS